LMRSPFFLPILINPFSTSYYNFSFKVRYALRQCFPFQEHRTFFLIVDSSPPSLSSESDGSPRGPSSGSVELFGASAFVPSLSAVKRHCISLLSPRKQALSSAHPLSFDISHNVLLLSVSYVVCVSLLPYRPVAPALLNTAALDSFSPPKFLNIMLPPADSSLFFPFF